ncbi:MAG: recombination mediator RecR [Myxococcota bacterium]|jgi:recombination protein RecR|nr:recombination mediator RecR [Myxococcota bacterium]
MSDPVRRLVDQLTRLPSVGEKTATRLAYHILRDRQDLARDLAEALVSVAEDVRLCSVCCNLSGTDPCPICAEPRRDVGLVCVVEQPQDIPAVEQSGEYSGTFHVLHGSLNPLDGVGPEDIHVAELLARVRDGDLSEVILATNPTVEGEATALYLAKLLKPLEIRVTRIAQGISVGSELEYTDGGTIARALRNRQEI